MNIALDAMGGDHAPGEIVAGAVMGARSYGVTVTLVGKPDLIEAELAKHDTRGLNLPVVPASQVIEMEDKPAQAVRSKKDSSMTVACRLVKEGKAEVFVTAGNTGGALAAGIFYLGRVDGIFRPALTVPFPTRAGFCTMLDIGANADVRPEYLPQFAVMGTIYSRIIMNVVDPTVYVLSNGEEPGKGNQLVRDAYDLLTQTPGIRFMGNAEAKEVLSGIADVVVTDGFTGNILIKTAEAVSSLVKDVLNEELRASPVSSLGGLLSKSAYRRVANRIDDSQFGGAVLLGLSNLVVVGHGRSRSTAVQHAIRVAKQAVEKDIIGQIQAEIHIRRQRSEERMTTDQAAA